MKLSMKFLAIATLLLSINFSAVAQDNQDKMKEKPSPVMVAQNQTDQMSQEVGLTESQLEQVKEINLAYAEKMKTVHENNKGNSEALKASKDEIQVARMSAMEEVLTAEQFVTFSKMKSKGHKKGMGKKKGNCKSTCKAKGARA